MVELLGDLEIGVFAVIHRPVASERQAVAGRASLRSLVTVLTDDGVGELVIESRGIQDADDRQTLVEAVHAGRCPPDLSYRFASNTDPLLWLPDAIVGLLGEAECRKADRWVAEVQRLVPIFEIRRLDAHEPRLPS